MSILRRVVQLSPGTFLFLATFMATGLALGQKGNSSPSFATETYLLRLDSAVETCDSLLTGCQQYKPVLFAQDLGNLCSPYRSMYFQNRERIGFNTGWFSAVDYFGSTEKTKYY